METIQTVSEWADSTFGTTSPILALGRAMEEISELRKLWHRYPECPDSEVVEEAADVCITLYRYINLIDPMAIEKKMEKNRSRTWVMTEEGVGQHL